jgi:hypothetical protein
VHDHSTRGVAAGTVVRGTRATQQNQGLLDYCVTNAVGCAFSASNPLVAASDHYPQVFTL